MRLYELLNRDKILATFKIDFDFGIETVQDVHFLEGAPFWMDNLGLWIENRGAAKHRRFVKDLLSKLNANTMSGFIGLTNCLSLQDTMWIREKGSTLTWENVNLFENSFSEVMTHLAFDGTGLYGERIKTTSPELTTDGNYDKCWIRRDGSTLLLKAGSIGARNAGLEPYSEYLASQVFEIVCNNSVKYNLEKYHNRVVTSCQSFSTEKAGFKPISLWLAEQPTIREILNILHSNGIDETSFREMMVADAICVNSDRHFGNFGFLTDNQSYEIIDMAPIFDFNLAFTPYAEIADFSVYESYLQSHSLAIGGEYATVAKSLLTSDIRSKVIALKDLKLTLPDWCFDESKYPFTKERLNILNKVKDTMIDRILGRTTNFPFINKDSMTPLSIFI